MASSPAPDTDKEPSKLDTEGLYLTLKEQLEADIEFSNAWRVRAREEFSFVAGRQFSEEDESALREQQRPVVVFNTTLKFIRAICGLETNNRHEIIYLPTDVTNEGEVKANEALTSVSEWMERGCKAQRQQGRAFRDCVICGLGGTDSLLDFDGEPQGKYIESRLPPLELLWDKNARGLNYEDRKRCAHVRKMLLSEARALIEGLPEHEPFDDEDLDAHWAGDISSPMTKPKTQLEKERREDARIKGPDQKREVHIVRVQWWEYEDYHRVHDTASGKNVDVPATKFKALKEHADGAGLQLQHAKMRRKVFKQAFVGSKILWCGDCPRQDGFSINFITGEPDDNEGTFFGWVRLLRDPGLWRNKFFSQLMHIVNTTAKGGIMIEADAIEGDVREFLANWSRQDSVSVLSRGAISAGKVQPKPGVGLTQGVISLMEIAKTAEPDTTGLNMEILGLADRDQPGVLEAQRKQAAMTILATFFDSYSSFKQEVGKTRLFYAQQYLFNQPRIIRIAGPVGYQAVRIAKDQITGGFDTIVDEAPTSPNQKEKVWAALGMLLPAIKGMLTPEVVVTLLDYVPGLPSKLVDALRKIVQQPPPPEVAAGKQLAITKIATEIQKMQGGIEKEKASADREAASALNLRAGAVLDLAQAGAHALQSTLDATEQAVTQRVAAAVQAGLPDGVVMGNASPPAPPAAPALPMPAPQQMPAPQPPVPPATQIGGLVPPGGLGQ